MAHITHLCVQFHLRLPGPHALCPRVDSLSLPRLASFFCPAFAIASRLPAQLADFAYKASCSSLTCAITGCLACDRCVQTLQRCIQARGLCGDNGILAACQKEIPTNFVERHFQAELNASTICNHRIAVSGSRLVGESNAMRHIQGDYLYWLRRYTSAPKATSA